LLFLPTISLHTTYLWRVWQFHKKNGK
jgi:hypothetical protein